MYLEPFEAETAYVAGPFHGGFAQHISGLQVVGISLTQGRGPLSTWPFHISSFIPFKPFHCSYSCLLYTSDAADDANVV